VCVGGGGLIRGSQKDWPKGLEVYTVYHKIGLARIIMLMFLFKS